MLLFIQVARSTELAIIAEWKSVRTALALWSTLTATCTSSMPASRARTCWPISATRRNAFPGTLTRLSKGAS